MNFAAVTTIVMGVVWVLAFLVGMIVGYIGHRLRWPVWPTAIVTGISIAALAAVALVVV